MRLWRLLGGAALLFVLLAAAAFLRARSFDGVLPPPVTANADIPVTLPDERRTVLGDLIRPDRPTVINLWASWCGPCRREASTIKELRRRFGQRINLVYLNVRDEAASREDLNRFLSEVGLPANSYAKMDASRIGALSNSTDVLVPRTLVFDRTGTAVARITGYKPLALDRVAGLLGS